MRTVRRLFYVDIVNSVAFVGLAFLSLFFFIDFVDELGGVAKGGFTTGQALLHSLLLMPGHVYELSPIAVLIGTIYTLARMAQSSEYTILRTGGLAPGRALTLLATLGLVFGALTFAVGDYLAPLAEAQAARVRTPPGMAVDLGAAGAWLKDRRSTPEGERSYSIHVTSAGADGTLRNVRIFEFDASGRLLQRVTAAHASIDKQSGWHLTDVQRVRWSVPNGANGTNSADGTNGAEAPRVDQEHLPRLDWADGLPANVVAAAVLPLNTMSTFDLLRYINHLADNAQAAQEYEIQFWQRAIYPFASLVMMALALPFAYLHARAGGVSLKVFGGIMLGISFVLLNNVARHLGMLSGWTPWIVAAGPSVLYMLLSLGAFTWLVSYR